MKIARVPCPVVEDLRTNLCFAEDRVSSWQKDEEGSQRTIEDSLFRRVTVSSLILREQTDQRTSS